MINFTLFFQDSKHVQEFLLYFLLDILMHYDIIRGTVHVKLHVHVYVMYAIYIFRCSFFLVYV